MFYSVLVVILAVVLWTVHEHLLSPLARFPGPALARFSNIWIVVQCRLGRRSEAVCEQHKKNGDFVRIAPNHVSVANPVAIQQIYGFKSGFLKGPFYEDKSSVWHSPFHQVEPVLFNTRDVQIHQRKKKILSPAFSAKNLQEFEPHMSATIQKFTACILRRLEPAQFTEIDFNEYSFDAIGEFAFGESFGFLDQEKDYLGLIQAVDARGEALNALGHIPPVFRSLIPYLPFDSFWTRGKQGAQALAVLGTQSFFKRRSQSTAEKRNDILSFLLDAKDPQTGASLTEEEIIAESISFIVGGSDTTSTTMTNFVDIVSRSPDVQKSLREELDHAFIGYMPPYWVPSFKEGERLPVLNAILRETMRIRPTSATGLERVTPKGGATVAGQFIPEGTLISVPALSVHHNERVFENPSVFSCQRWLKDDLSSTLMESFIPFSTGPRACIGRNFAWMEMLKALATLFKMFEVRRIVTSQTAIREGFFVKNIECKIRLQERRTVTC
ncbi:hypothetical protein N7486_003421 [Penicillium sp. IBT 16267x]|nr:hypothetical protein N7486_003421 [Penicillium sp. IBT 16267x]